MSNKDLQGRILKLEDTIQQLHDLSERLRKDAEEADRRVDVMRDKLKKAGLYL
jgi:predicted  nucleic acid-binding Zn-ribbon protein